MATKKILAIPYKSVTTIEMNALTDMVVNERVNNTDTLTVWEYNGTIWKDTGAAVLNPEYIILDHPIIESEFAALTVGSLFYTSELGGDWLLKTSADTYYNLGSEISPLMKNGDTQTHLNGQPVYVFSGTGKLPVVKLASATQENTSYTIALATQDVLHTGSGRGRYCTFGVANGIVITNVKQTGENIALWIEGAPLFLSTETGKLTTVRPVAPNHGVLIGYLVDVTGANCSIFVNTNVGAELGELHDVDLTKTKTTPIDADNVLLQDSEDSSIWKKFSWLNLKAGITSIVNTWSLGQIFTKGIVLSKEILTGTRVNNSIENGGTSLYFTDNSGNQSEIAKADGTILYYNTKWFVPAAGQTISANGTTVTMLNPVANFQFATQMLGAKIIISGETRYISAYTSPSVVTVSEAFSQNYSNVAFTDWGVYNKCLQIANNSLLIYWPSFSLSTFFNGSTIILDTSLSIAQALARYRNDYAHVWSSTSLYAGTKDLGYRKVAPGVLEIFDGITNGATRDINLRTLYLSTGAGDVVGDHRFTLNAGVLQFERCTVLSATKGGGTWIVDAKIDATGQNIFGGATDNSTFETDGTLKFNGAATVWRDIDFPIIVRTTGANIPVLSTFNGNLLMPQWAVNDFNQCESQEFVHEWKEGSTCYFHLHLNTAVLDATIRYVNFEIEYGYSVAGVWTFPAVVTTGDIAIPANTAAKTQIVMPLFNFAPTNTKIADHCIARLKRIAAIGTAPSVDPFIPMLQMHIECDTTGSRNMITK